MRNPKRETLPPSKRPVRRAQARGAQHQTQREFEHKEHSRSPWEACTRAKKKLALGTPAAAGTQRRTQTRGTLHPRAGQDTVETLKQAYFQGYPESAGCVQGSIDSRNSAIHSAYRISLRPSSLFEPRHPSLKVVRKRSPCGGRRRQGSKSTTRKGSS